MKKFKYFIFTLVLFFIITPKVFAGVNMSTYYNVDMFDYKTYLEDSSCGGTNLYDFINNYINSIDWSTSQNQLIIAINLNSSHNPNDIRLYFVPTTSVNSSQGHKIWTFGYYQTSGWNNVFKEEASKQYVGSLVINKNNCNSNTDMSSLLTFLTTTANSGAPSNSFYTPGFNYSSGSGYYSFSWYISTRLSDTVSYNVGGWWYYSSYDLYFASQSEASGTNKYWKTIHINDNNTNYSYDDKLPSYYDIYPPVEEPTFIGYKDSLDTFYTSISSSNYSNYQLKLKFRVPQSVLGFYQTPQEYIDNTTFNYVCSGRIDNTDYYYYESFPCSLTSSYTTTTNTIEYTFNNISTTQNLSNYDKLYITINTNYVDSNVSTTIFGFEYTYNLGSFYNTDYKGNIYEEFTNLPINFEYYFSSNNYGDNAKLYVDTSYFTNDIYTIGFSTTNHSNYYAVGQSILANPNAYESNLNFKVASVSNSYDTGVMIFQQNGSRSLEHLNLFFNGGMYISSNTGSNTFYYVDSNGVITSGQFIQPILVDNNNSYDIGYYVNIVNNFIDGLSNDTLEISNLTQSFYNGLPVFFQSFILVVFILFCIYFVYLLIKR